jgi:hypothetical protein
MSKWFNTSHGWWNMPANPLGNYREPKPTTITNQAAAKASWLPEGVWWWKRNPATNFCDFWVGLYTLSDGGAWKGPAETGWFYVQANPYMGYWFKPGRWARPYYRRDGKRWTCYIGWRSSGAFGIAFRRS